MLVDSHAHLDSSKYDADREAMLERAWEQGIRAILSIGIGDGPATMQGALELARQYANQPGIPRIFATAGIHPHEARLADRGALSKLDSLLAEPEILAAGEIGLDYYYDHSPRAAQKDVFLHQMEIAAVRRRPIIIHCRSSKDSTDAWDDTLEILESNWRHTGLGGILHCFSGEWQHAQRAMDCGFFISFAGNLTFPKAEGLRAVAGRVPLDRLLIETDAPFLAPVPHRGQRNEPAWVRTIAHRLAEIRGIQAEEAALITANNFFRLFNASPPLESIRQA